MELAANKLKLTVTSEEVLLVEREI